MSAPRSFSRLGVSTIIGWRAQVPLPPYKSAKTIHVDTGVASMYALAVSTRYRPGTQDMILMA
ncbi:MULTISPECIES: hypothetical protein [Rhodococcus]|uniref:hypothetical protein n=1 Tax=Rhodococcus TaxID=1827 RepID=UPI0012E3DDE8|nr:MULTISPECIES: hypothetical protein [Rhodococcus]MEA1798888.1 hypothetical protein [Rhodococcus qingshengii]